MKKNRLILAFTCFVFILFVTPSIIASTVERKPLIGISGNMQYSQTFPGYSYSFAGNTYVNSIVAAGGIPIIIPVVEDLSVIPFQIKDLDGIVLSGGQDVNPLKYKEEPSLNIGEVNHIRDAFDFELIKNATKNKIPILGICRGHQLINVFYGGTLHQDIPTSVPNAVAHRQSKGHEFGTHTVLVKKGSWLSKVIDDKSEIAVNSFHHQAVKGLAPGFIVTAEAKDGVVEGIEKQGDDFCVGVQWHPEMMHKRDPQMLKIYKAFVDVCREKAKK